MRDPYGDDVTTERGPRRAYPLAAARAVANQLAALLEPSCVRVAIVGSIRRGAEIVGDIELLAEPVVKVTGHDLFGEPSAWENVLDAAVRDLLTYETLSHRLDVNGRPAFGERYKRLVWNEPGPARGIALDLFSVIPPAEWGLLSLIRTGPASFSQRLVTSRMHGGWLPLGYRVMDGAVWRVGRDGKPAEPVHTPTEDDVFSLIGRGYVRPEERV